MTDAPTPVPLHMMGEAAAATRPGDDPALFGSVRMEGPQVVEVRSYQTFRLIYTCGRLGLDDTGGIRIALRIVTDAGRPQVTDPGAANYVSVRSSGQGRLIAQFDTNGGQRPWTGVLTIRQHGGYLREGDTIDVVIGDTTHGGPGFLMPTFFDGGFVFRPMADVQATGVFEPLPGTPPSVRVVAGPAASWRAVLPTLRRPGETFALGIKAEDRWGNPTDQGANVFSLRPSQPVEGLPDQIALTSDAMLLENLRCQDPGTLRITLTATDGTTVHAGPLVIRDGAQAHFWGDLHGQTGETVGTNTVEHYFDFARNKAFLEVSSHQANDFQINATFWQHLNGLTAALDEPGRFTVLPGYEWSGNTAVGGDHNVFYRQEGAPIYRCSHALVADRSDADTDAYTLSDLYACLRKEPIDAVMYAHVGGRYANIHYDHDPLLESAVEVHSAWGSFEWVLTDGFALRRRVGVVANSDGHKGRPGASYPGASIFGAYGGLTCFQMPENTRDAVFDAIRNRRTYGTSGPRVFVDLTAELPEGATRFACNPMADPLAEWMPVKMARMGDILQTAGSLARVRAEVKAPNGIAWLELRNGTEVLLHKRGFETGGHRVRVMWEGAEYRGRGRNTRWAGRATLQGARIARMARVNRLNLEAPMDQVGSRSVIFDTVTTGNRMGFDLWIDAQEDDARLSLHTNRGALDLALSQIRETPVALDAGGLERRLWVQRMPDESLPTEMSIELDVQIAKTGDTPLWLVGQLEDGNMLWTSPMYLFRDAEGAGS